MFFWISLIDLAELLKLTSLIIWDEAPMANKANMEALDRMLRDILEIDLPFGGITIVFGGDFKQILPVIPKGNRARIVNATLKKRASIWSRVQELQLKVNMRLLDPQDRSYSKYIMDLGNGSIPEDNNGCIPLPRSSIVSSQKNLIDSVYENFQENFNKAHYLCDRSILAVTNEQVNSINEKIFSTIPGEKHEYPSSDTLILNETVQDANQYPPEYLHSLDANGTPPHLLELKIGCPIMLLRNLNPSQGLCNGTRLVVTNLRPHVLEAEVMCGAKKGLKVFIPRIDFIPQMGLPFDFKRRQFPVRVCYAMTINKSQGQTLDHVGLYLERPVFTHGQLYVAMSRVKRSRNLKIFTGKKESTTRNVVYKEIL